MAYYGEIFSGLQGAAVYMVYFGHCRSALMISLYTAAKLTRDVPSK
jgi:hypothetical protein